MGWANGELRPIRLQLQLLAAGAMLLAAASQRGDGELSLPGRNLRGPPSSSDGTAVVGEVAEESPPDSAASPDDDGHEPGRRGPLLSQTDELPDDSDGAGDHGHKGHDGGEDLQHSDGHDRSTSYDEGEVHEGEPGHQEGQEGQKSHEGEESREGHEGQDRSESHELGKQHEDGEIPEVSHSHGSSASNGDDEDHNASEGSESPGSGEGIDDHSTSKGSESIDAITGSEGVDHHESSEGGEEDITHESGGGSESGEDGKKEHQASEDSESPKGGGSRESEEGHATNEDTSHRTSSADILFTNKTASTRRSPHASGAARASAKSKPVTPDESAELLCFAVLNIMVLLLSVTSLRRQQQAQIDKNMRGLHDNVGIPPASASSTRPCPSASPSAPAMPETIGRSIEAMMKVIDIGEVGSEQKMK